MGIFLSKNINNNIVKKNNWLKGGAQSTIYKKKIENNNIIYNHWTKGGSNSMIHKGEKI